MELITHIWAISKRQTQNIAIPAQCYAVASERLNRSKQPDDTTNDQVALYYQSVGPTPSLCVDDGVFSSAFSELNSCTSANSGVTTNLQTVALLASPLSYCSSVISSLGQAALKSSLSPASAAASTTSSSNTISDPIATSTAPYSTPTAASLSASPTTTSTASHHNLTVGAIAGIAVGAVLVLLLILAFVTFFAWRHTRNKKRAKAAAAHAAEQATMDKAQLHSDEYKPKRNELVGSQVPQRVRAIEGLHEIEYHDLKAGRGELSANEVAAAEKDVPVG